MRRRSGKPPETEGCAVALRPDDGMLPGVFHGAGMGTNRRDGWLAALALVVVAGLYFWTRQASPEQVAAALFDMHLPSRYIFVGDAVAPRAATVDKDEARLAAELALARVPQVMAVDPYRGVLAYASAQDEAVFLHHLASHDEKEVALPHAVQGLAFAEGGTQLFVYGREAVSVVDMQSQTVRTLRGFADVRSGHIDPAGRRVLLLDEGERSVRQWSLPDDALSAAALPASWQDFTASALTPDGEYLLFGVYDAVEKGYLGIVWHLEGRRWRGYAMSAPLLRPLSDNRASALFFIDRAGQGVRVNAENLDDFLVFETAKAASHAALGWLDTRLLVAGEAEIRVHDSASLQAQAVRAFPGPARDIFITVDSKTALLTAVGSRDLLLYSLRDGSEAAVALGEAAQPATVVMGAGYTLCH